MAPRFVHPICSPPVGKGLLPVLRRLQATSRAVNPSVPPDASAHVRRAITGALPVHTHALQDGLEHVLVGGTRRVCATGKGAGISVSAEGGMRSFR